MEVGSQGCKHLVGLVDVEPMVGVGQVVWELFLLLMSFFIFLFFFLEEAFLFVNQLHLAELDF